MDWLILEEFPTYSISEYGEVRNNRTDRILRPFVTRDRLYVTLSRDREQYTRQISTLMLNAWRGPHRNIYFTTTLHLDGDKTNCCLENLLWRPRWFVHAYYTELDRGRPLSNRPIYLIETEEVFSNCEECAMTYGFLQRDILSSALMGDMIFPNKAHCVFIR